MRAARSKARTPNWPTFAPPQWPGFTPPLTPWMISVVRETGENVDFSCAHFCIGLAVPKCPLCLIRVHDPRKLRVSSSWRSVSPIEFENFLNTAIDEVPREHRWSTTYARPIFTPTPLDPVARKSTRGGGIEGEDGPPDLCAETTALPLHSPPLGRSTVPLLRRTNKARLYQ